MRNRKKPQNEKKRTRRKKKSETNGESTAPKPLFPSIGLPQYTLLEIPDRAELPEIPSVGRPSILVQIVTETPDLYKELISYVRHGVAGHVAAESIGISEKTFYEWASIGRQQSQQEVPPDTFYTRFYNDIRRAVAIKRSELEIEIAATSPSKWLSHGPGRIFGDNWSDQKQINDHTDEEPDILSAPKPNEQIEEDSSSPGDKAGEKNIVDGNYRVIEEKEGMDVLKELEEQGIISVSRSYKSQVRKQENE